MWQPVNLTGESLAVEEKLYDHGFSEEQVIEIKANRAELDKKLLQGYNISIEDMKTIIVPFLRINRVEEFILKAPKEKVKTEKKPKITKEKAAKVPKQKKLTIKEKKEISLRIQKLFALKAAGKELTEDDTNFIEYAKTVL